MATIFQRVNIDETKPHVKSFSETACALQNGAYLIVCNTGRFIGVLTFYNSIVIGGSTS